MAGANSESMSINKYCDHRTVRKLKSKSGSVDFHYPALYESTPDEFKRYAEKELNETAENRTEGIEEMKKFVKKENMKCSEDLMLMTLRNAKFDIKKAKLKLKSFLKLRENTIDSLSRIDTETIELIIDDMIVGVLPHRDKAGRLMIFSRPTFNLDRYAAHEVVCCIAASLMFALTFPLTSICGVSYIVECEVASQLNLFRFLTSIRSSLISIIKDSPIRFGKMDVINEYCIMRWFVNTIVSFLPGKLTGRISFHGADLQSLQEVFHPDLLPTDFGGTSGSLNNKFYREKLLDYLLKLRAES